MVELAVLDARAGRHSLHVAAADDGAVAHAVAMRELAFEHVRDDLHVAMRVSAEALARLHPVLVDDAQVPVAHEARVVVVRERKGVATVEPAQVGAAPVVRTANE